MTVPYYVNEDQSDIRASNLGGMRWSATASSRPGRFQARRNASLNYSAEEQFSCIALAARDPQS